MGWDEDTLKRHIELNELFSRKGCVCVCEIEIERAREMEERERKERWTEEIIG